jgi:hypothetical protein
MTGMGFRVEWKKLWYIAKKKLLTFGKANRHSTDDKKFLPKKADTDNRGLYGYGTI